jgi:hypothetical protein
VMMGMRMPETCWDIFERRAINLRDWCIWLVDLFKCMMMHGLKNSKFTNNNFMWRKSVCIVRRNEKGSLKPFPNSNPQSSL